MVNYKDFLKFSYLTHLFINHCMLEHAMNEKDSEDSGQITVKQLDEILTSAQFGLPPDALD